MFQRNIVSIIKIAVQLFIYPSIGFVESIIKKVKICNTNKAHPTLKNKIRLQQEHDVGGNSGGGKEGEFTIFAAPVMTSCSCKYAYFVYVGSVCIEYFYLLNTFKTANGWVYAIMHVCTALLMMDIILLRNLLSFTNDLLLDLTEVTTYTQTSSDTFGFDIQIQEGRWP